MADLLWVPLFQNSEDSEEITRNVAAACLGKLATTAPSRYLPQLHVSPPHLIWSYDKLISVQERIQDPSPAARATVISAIRYTFVESSRGYDELIGSIIMDFLSLIADPDLVRLLWTFLGA